jgi:hypothetical protein
LKGAIGWTKDISKMIEAIVKIVIAGGGKEWDGQVLLHLVEKTPVLAPFPVAHQVTNVNGKDDLPVATDITQKGIEKGVISLIVSKDGEREIVGIYNLDS